MGTGLIYAAIVAAWAAYLVPLWLRRHDEAAASRSVDKFSAAMRVLARRKTPAYATPADEAADQLPRRPVLGPPPRTSARPAGLSAATRRRRVLVFLVFALTVVTVLAALTVVPWWAVAIPAAVVLLFLFVSASSARAERSAARPTRRSYAPVRRGSRVTASYAHGSPAAQPGVDDEATVIVRRPSADPAPEPVVAEQAASDKGDLWDPVEVPLPTYVTKARAPYTVRTVDLGAPGTWTSGRLPEADLLSRTPMSAAELIETVQAPPPPEEELEHRRAVGD